MTDDEKAVIAKLAEAWNAFVRLPVEHGADRDEFNRAIHVAQNIVLSRPTLRSLNGPDGWRI